MRHRKSPPIRALAVLLLLVACGDIDRSGRDASTVTVLFESNDYVFGPSPDDWPKFLVFLPLVSDDAQVGRLAERWEHSPDYRTWTIHLRRGVRWHDGVPVTAHDVEFTLDLMRHSEVLRHAPDAYTVTVLGDYTLEIEYRQPREELGGWTVYYPKHLLEDLDPAEFFSWEFWKRPVGNGPYRVVRHVPDTMFELEANSDFYEGKPAIERVILRLGGTGKMAELMSGSVDIVAYLRQTDIRKLADDPRFQVYHQWAYSEPVAIHWNHRHPLLGDPRVRRALTMAIDRRELFDLLDLPDELPIFDGLAHWRRAHRQFQDSALGEPLPYDPTAAERLLEAAGWIDIDGDGVRERAGRRAEFTMLAGAGGILETLEPVIYLQDQLDRVGVAMEIQPLDNRAAFQRYRASDYDAFITSFRFDPADLLEADWFGDGSPIGYRNPQIVERLRAIHGTAEPEAQDSLYGELYPIFRNDVPVTFLFPWTETFAAHRRIRGLGLERPNPIQAMEDLWIEEAPSSDAGTTSITVQYPVDEWGLGPAWSYPSQFLVFLPLVERDERGELKGLLARDWEHSSDQREWTIHLRTDVRWHDGAPVTAHDIAFTLGLWSLPEIATAASAATSVEVLNDSTYTLTLERQAIGDPLDDYNVYYPKHLLEVLDPKDFYEWEFWKHPVGNGPYRFVRSLEKTMIELEANPDYFRGPPRIDRVFLKLAEPNLTELLSGAVDVLSYVNPLDLQKLGDDPRFQVYYQTNLYRTKGILWNQDVPLFQDAQVRLALTYAIDRRELLRLLNYPQDSPLFDVIYTARQLIRGELPDPVPFDRERADSLLRDLGWEDLDGDGIREHDGQPFRFTALVAPGNFARGAEQAAVYVQDQLRRIGVRMDLQTVEGSTARDRIWNGDFRAAIADITYTSHERFFGERSPMGYRDPEVVQLIEAAHRAIDPAVVDDLYRQLWSILQADLPVTFLFPANWATVVHRRVHGLSSPYRAEPAWYMEHLWIDDGNG